MMKHLFAAALVAATMFGAPGNSAEAAIGDTCTSSATCDGGYCSKSAGECAGTGVCVASRANDFCITLYDPVCGCDGKTYGNDCEASRAGMNIQHRGACVITGSCGDNTQCPSGYCATVQGSCSSVGTCSPRPTACTQDVSPVCGCDGNTYSNECWAAAAGTSVALQGTCPTMPTTCTSDAECSGALCTKAAGECGGAGVCLDRPTACLNLYDPVCGCDGKTYANNCEALKAGVNVAALGVCKPACIPTMTRERAKACKDGIDNDCDGLIDRLDKDCR